jgi:proteasome accessory factor B
MQKHAERLINLVTYLLHSRNPIPWKIIRERMQEYKKANESTALRMFERDKKELKEIGVPIHYDGKGYSIPEEHYYLPEINLTPDEAFLLWICSQTLRKTAGFNRISEVTSSVYKVIFDSLPISPSKYIQALEKYYVFRFSSELDTKRVSKLIKLLLEAVIKSKRVFIEYYSISDDKKSTRVVEPYGMLIHKGTWYLVGKDLTKMDIRVYKLTRISKISVNKRNPGKPDFVVPKDFKIKNYLGKKAWELASTDESIEVKVKFSSEIAWWVKENFDDKNEVIMNQDESCIVNFKVSLIEPFIRWIMRMGNQAEILSPEHVRNEIKHAIEETLKKYS